MSGEKEHVIWNKKDLEGFYNKVLEDYDVEEPIKIIIKDYKPRRTLKANSLYWMWMDYLARVFTENEKIDGVFNKDDIHDICRHKFLGYKDKKFNATTIPQQLIETSTMDSGDFFDYMSQVDDWALGMKIFLPRPKKNEYDDIKKTQKGGQ